jgi:DHA1 family bicyclomycin/chloramphenicol resistance-like MFS transporter
VLERARLVVILGALSAFGPLSVDFYLPALPRLTRDFGAAASAGQLTLSGCVLGLAVGQLAAGPLSDRLGRRPPLVVGLLVYGAASVACAVAPSIWLLAAFRLVQGLSGAAGLVISRSIVRDLHAGVDAARLFSVLILVVGVVPALAPVVGGELLRVTSWRGLFVILAVVDAAILAAVALWLRETLPPGRRRAAGGVGRGFGELLRDRLFVVYAATLGLGFAAMFAYISGSSFVLQDIYGTSPQLYGVVFGMNACGLVACSQVNRALVGRLAPERLLRVGVAASAGSGVALLAVVLAGGIGLAGILPCLFVTVSAIGFIGPNASALALTDYPHLAGSASALLGVFQFGFGAAAAPLVGIAGKTTAVPMALLIALFGTSAVAVTLVARRRAPVPAAVSASAGERART